MSEGCISRGFRGRRTRPEGGDRLPPGQYLVDGFPVLSAGPAPHTPLEEWDFSIVGEVDEPKKWTWEGIRHSATHGDDPPPCCGTERRTDLPPLLLALA